MSDLLHELAAQAGRNPAHAPLASLPKLLSNGSLVRALAAGGDTNGVDSGPALIAEIKQASPSQGQLLSTSAAHYLEAVRQGGACAISAVTAQGRFAGSFDLLRQAHATGLPTLMKDFVATVDQLDLALQHGASAVLLIEGLVSPEQREILVDAAHERGLEVLLEVHDSQQGQAALRSRADILGVNSRDLQTLQVDFEAACILLRELVKADRRPVLLLSGILGPREAELARAAGASGILVGTALLTHRNPTMLARALRRPLAKVCGNQSRNDVAAALQADLIGVVVDTESPRNVPLATAATLLRQAEAQGAASVAVTRFVTTARLQALAHELRPTYLQVHGPLSTQDVEKIQAMGVGVIHAVAPGVSPVAGCDLTITDATAEGGSGQVHDAKTPVGRGLHLIAGGLDAQTVANRIRKSGACGADASSRLEDAANPGTKDAGQVQAFVTATHEARRSMHGT